MTKISKIKLIKLNFVHPGMGVDKIHFGTFDILRYPSEIVMIF